MRDKRAKFVELANKRVNKALDQLRLIGNLTNRAAYDFTEEDGKKIIKALQKELDGLRTRFTEGGGGSDREFRI
jgi:hypothetical protein